MPRLARCLAVIALVLAGPAAASAQAPGQVESDARLASVRPRLDAALDAARQEQLPMEWLRDKIAEGLSKGVPAPRIAGAVEVVLGRMRTSDAMIRSFRLRGAARRRLLRASVDALSAGAPAEGVERLIRHVRTRGGDAAAARRALVTVAELGERGFSGAAAVESVAEAHQRGGGQAVAELARRARGIRDDAPGGRDRALRGLGRGVGSGVGSGARRGRGVDGRGGRGDHGRRGGGPR
ncbi:MAG: hypothetical protein RLP09_17190 [Sandaracinaceae bacterium]